MSEQERYREAPWSAGFRAARANLVPGLLVQSVMVGVLVAYYLCPPVAGFLDRIAMIKTESGYWFSIAVGIIAGGVLPEVLRWVVLQRVKWSKRNTTNVLFAIPFWSFIGILVDWFYRRQAEWFGDEASLAVVVPQVLIDQFVFTPVLTAPMTAILYDWKDAGFQWSRSFLTTRYYRDSIFPTLVAIWCVWIPIVTVLYTLPETVQIPLYALALTLWVMLYTWMSEDRARRNAG
ncbi:hypothetical protein [Haloferula rosea]|uniref:Uncharacterized protein n=1 Tax=Haloferula rosea TaxID=490093 RepID=A0A934RD11_9BACT|nr:hypothetical protein [Haloferula rosea]MBK1827473.1 hypothetical protein [Haloferula rosea]